MSGADQSPAWAPDGKRVVFVRLARLGGRSALWVVNQTRRARRLITASRNVANPAWSPDGRRIAFNDDRDHLFVAPANGRGSRKRLGPPGLLGRAPRWSPDGHRIAFLAIRSHAITVTILDLDNGRIHSVFSATSDASVAWSSDGRRLAVMWSRPNLPCQSPNTCTRLEIATVRISDGRAQTIYTALNGEPYGIDWRR